MSHADPHSSHVTPGASRSSRTASSVLTAATLAALALGHVSVAVAAAAPTRRIVVMANGNHIEVERAVQEGDKLRLDLPSGGSIVIPYATVKRVSRDSADLPAKTGDLVVIGGKSPATVAPTSVAFDPREASMPSLEPDAGLPPRARDLAEMAANERPPGFPPGQGLVDSMSIEQGALARQATNPPQGQLDPRQRTAREQALTPRPGMVGKLLSRASASRSRVTPAGEDAPQRRRD